MANQTERLKEPLSSRGNRKIVANMCVCVCVCVSVPPPPTQSSSSTFCRSIPEIKRTRPQRCCPPARWYSSPSRQRTVEPFPWSPVSQSRPLGGKEDGAEPWVGGTGRYSSRDMTQHWLHHVIDCLTLH